MTEYTRALIQECLRKEDGDTVSGDSDFFGVVGSLIGARSGRTEPPAKWRGERPLPSRAAVIEMVESFRSVLFPGFFGTVTENDRLHFHLGTVLDHAMHLLREQLSVTLGLHQDQNGGRRALREHCVRDISHNFLKRLPDIQDLLTSDVEAAYKGDPAATSASEIVLCYPGIFAMTNYRIAHVLSKLGVPLISRIITEHAHSITGIDIHPGAEIGESFFIDHGTGVVVGATAIIGDRVRLYHGVTLGAKSFKQDESGVLIKGTPRHPIVEDDVIIYAGATILGRVTIGHGSVIGGNVWLTRDVPPGSIVTQGRSIEEQQAGGGGI